MCLNSVHCLLQVDNEENVLVCLRIIIELHKQYRPQINTEVSVMSMVTDTIGVKPLLANDNYRKISNIRRTKCENLNVSHLVLQSSLSNLLKPGVKSRMKM